MPWAVIGLPLWGEDLRYDLNLTLFDQASPTSALCFISRWKSMGVSLKALQSRRLFHYSLGAWQGRHFDVKMLINCGVGHFRLARFSNVINGPVNCRHRDCCVAVGLQYASYGVPVPIIAMLPQGE